MRRMERIKRAEMHDSTQLESVSIQQGRLLHLFTARKHGTRVTTE